MNNRGARCSNEFSDLRGAPVHKSDVFSANEWLDLYPRATFGRGPQFNVPPYTVVLSPLSLSLLSPFLSLAKHEKMHQYYRLSTYEFHFLYSAQFVNQSPISSNRMSRYKYRDENVVYDC